MNNVKLSELCEIRIGRTPRRNNRKYWKDGIHPWITIRELDYGLINSSNEQITDLALKNMPKRTEPGTILYSFKLSIGKMGIANIPLWHNEAIASLIIDDKNLIHRDYLYYYLKYVGHRSIANNAVLGKTLNKKSLSDIIIILPDLKKQIEISKKIKQIDTILLNLKNTEKEFENLSESLFYKYID
mgnify:CR=1 FL=1|jgi:type I restriction enzyme S subunit